MVENNYDSSFPHEKNWNLCINLLGNHCTKLCIICLTIKIIATFRVDNLKVYQEIH